MDGHIDSRIYRVSVFGKLTNNNLNRLLLLLPERNKLLCYWKKVNTDSIHQLVVLNLYGEQPLAAFVCRCSIALHRGSPLHDRSYFYVAA